ncbi:unnamed protein product [Camellia sinensis]
MGVMIKLIDAVLLLFFLVVILAAPTFDAQVCFRSKFFPNFLVDLNLWFTSEYGDYLLIEKPSLLGLCGSSFSSSGHLPLQIFMLFLWEGSPGSILLA